jgi:uncharacterized membrane-anchored protein YitT (DUF2179 family)
MKVKDFIKEFIYITIATVIVGVAVFFFLVPSRLSIGSISGLAIVLSNLVPLSVSQLTMIMNVALLVISFLLVGKDFGIKTVYTSILLPVVIGIFEKVFPNNQSLTGDQVIDGIGYCLVVSIGLSMLFIDNASSGGLDIIAKLMNKFLRMDLGKAMGLSGMAVALSSALVYDTKTVVLSVMGTYFSGIVLDYFIFGSTEKKRVCIISAQHEKILDYILYEIHSGATQYHAYGTFTDRMYWEINTIVDRNEYAKLIKYITAVDPKAFVTVYSVNEMMYQPKPKDAERPEQKQ